MSTITTRVCGVADKRRAELLIDGHRWAIIDWGGPGKWCIEDDQGRCLTHAEDTRGTAPTLADTIVLAETMIRDGRMPSPEQAKRLAVERHEKQRHQRDAWEHPERLYEALADALELWIDRDPDFTRSNSYRRLSDEAAAWRVERDYTARHWSDLADGLADAADMLRDGLFDLEQALEATNSSDAA